MIPTAKRISAARRLIEKQRANIAFYKERVKIQALPGYNPIFPSGIIERQYYPLDIQMAENRLKEYYRILGECQAIQNQSK